MKKLLGWLIIVSVFVSCQKGEQTCELDPDILNQNITVEIKRLEHAFFTAKTEEDILNLLETHDAFANEFLQATAYESKEEMAAEMILANSDTLLMELYQEVNLYFGDISDLERDLENAFKYIKYYYPNYKIPQVYTFVSGFGTDIFLSESMLVIGLDYYLPFEHRFQPPDLPQYISRRYQKEYIVPMVVTAISAEFNETDMSQSSLLAEMIYYGKAYHFTKSILPCTSDKFIIGYKQEEIEACFANETFIWAHFVENDLLFETNPFVVRKYTGEAPATDEISPDAPGRIGRWLGWNIVDDYRFNNKFSLEELMLERDTEKIFRQSGYKPRP